MKDTSNQMAPHIRKTVEEIDNDILQLRDDIAEMTVTRTVLVKLYAGDTEIADAPSGDLAPVSRYLTAPATRCAPTANRPKWLPKPSEIEAEPAPAVRKALASPTPATDKPKRAHATSADTIRIMAAARTCPEPFTAASLAVATGKDAKSMGCTLWRWEQAKWIAKVARGEYKRTGTFPAETPAEA